MNRQKTLLAFTFAGALALGACTTVGNEALRDQSAETLHRKITEGKSTRDEVVALLGKPNSVLEQDSGGAIWIYRYQRAKPWPTEFIPLVPAVYGRLDLQSKELVVNFDSSNVVTRYRLRESTDLIKHGAFE